MRNRLKLIFLKPRTQREAAEFIYEKDYNNINLQTFRRARDELIEEGFLQQVNDSQRNQIFKSKLDVERSEYAFLDAIEKSRFVIRDEKGILRLDRDVSHDSLQQVVDDGIGRLANQMTQSLEDQNKTNGDND